MSFYQRLLVYLFWLEAFSFKWIHFSRQLANILSAGLRYLFTVADSVQDRRERGNLSRPPDLLGAPN